MIVTSKGGEQDRLRGIEAGADAYIAKDEFNQQALLETIRAPDRRLGMTAAARRIVVCDGSMSKGAALGRFLDHDPGLEVVGVFDSAAAMLARLGDLDPNLVIADLGGVAVADIAQMRKESLPVVVLVPAGEENSEPLGDALGAGALEAIREERLNLDDSDGVWATALRSRVKRLASLRLKRRAGDPRPAAPAPTRSWRRPGASYRAVGVGASVGGPPALAALLGGLPPTYPLPVLVVQHMAPGFGLGLAQWLDRERPAPGRDRR